MARPEINSFSAFVLSSAELLQGSILTSDQLKVIQNDLAAVAELRLNIDLDPKNIVAFAQHEAFLKGQMAAYRYILLRSLESEETAKARTSIEASENNS